MRGRSSFCKKDLDHFATISIMRTTQTVASKSKQRLTEVKTSYHRVLLWYTLFNNSQSIICVGTYDGFHKMKFIGWVTYIEICFKSVRLSSSSEQQTLLIEEFDHGSDWTLAAGLTHASRANEGSLLLDLAADGWVMYRELPDRGGYQLETTVNTA